MNLLYINNDFCGSRVHSYLVKKISSIGVDVTVYCPIRSASDFDKNKVTGSHINIIYSLIIKSWYKYVYHYKLFKLYPDLKKKVNVANVDMIHAATLFTDGGLAYKLHKETGIPYIIAVRNTDINLFIKNLIHTHAMGRKILLDAEKIVFISTCTKDIFSRTKFARPIISQIAHKMIVCPNGIDEIWLNNIKRTPPIKRGPILYVGDFTPNKNVCRLIDAVKQFRDSNGYGELIVVGGGRDENNEVQNKIAKCKEFVKYLGPIYDKKELMKVMRSASFFAMPSIFETFGLVYIEALSQNLPILYTKGQGVDGFFDESVGLSVNPKSTADIIHAISEIYRNPDSFSNGKVNFSLFSWDDVANTYYNIYKNYLRN